MYSGLSLTQRHDNSKVLYLNPSLADFFYVLHSSPIFLMLQCFALSIRIYVSLNLHANNMDPDQTSSIWRSLISIQTVCSSRDF